MKPLLRRDKFRISGVDGCVLSTVMTEKAVGGLSLGGSEPRRQLVPR